MIGRERDTKQPEYDWYDKQYLLARWGEELESFQVLKQKAINKLKENTTVRFLKMKGEINTFLENPALWSKICVEKGQSFGFSNDLIPNIR